MSGRTRGELRPRPSAKRLGLGVGLDLPWGKAIGFDPVSQCPTPKVEAFLRRCGDEFAYVFFSFQPKGPTRLTLPAYLPAYRRLVDCLPASKPLAFHQTTLNLGSVDEYPRDRVIAFTNELVAEFDFAWVVEDLGIWSVRGIPLPYPLPPYLIDESIGPIAGNIRETQARLDCPLHIEFPGFTDNVTIVLGGMDAYTHFRRTADAADAWVTLDVGHLLSYRWRLGHRGSELFDNLEALPLERCRELHLSGCTIHNDRFLDLHHGVLLDEQVELTERLLEACPNLVGVTYEDPRYDGSGALIRKSLRNLGRIRQAVETWSSTS